MRDGVEQWRRVVQMARDAYEQIAKHKTPRKENKDVQDKVLHRGDTKG